MRRFLPLMMILCVATLPALADTAREDGYSWAQENSIKHKSDCTGKGEFLAGCEAFVDELSANDMPPPSEEGTAPSAGTEDGSGPYENQGDTVYQEDESGSY